MNLRMWARAYVTGHGEAQFNPLDSSVDGYDSDAGAWPTGPMLYLIQSGALWEIGVGTLRDSEPGDDFIKALTRQAVAQSSAGAGVFESFPGELCDVAFSHATMLPYRRWWMLYGDGSDGDVTLSGAVTLTRSMYYRNLTITDDAVVTTGGYAIYVRDKLTLPDSRATASPVFEAAAGASGDAVTSSGGFGGNGGTYTFGIGNPATSGSPGSSGYPYQLGGDGGDGGSGANAPGGNFWNFGAPGGGAVSSTLLPSPVSIPDIEFLVGGAGGAGGGGGGVEDVDFYSGGQGGLGGAGGSVLRIHARLIDGGAWAGAPLLLGRCNGGPGSAGSPGVGASGAGGGGGGGGGGALVIVSDYINRLPWKFTADGGAPGDGTAEGGQGGAVYAIVRATP